MELPRLFPLEYQGELVALVSERRVHIVAPWLLDRPNGDRDLRFVAFMCVFCGQALRAGRPVTSATAEAWARHALIDHGEVDDRDSAAVGEAERLRVPLHQLLAALRDDGRPTATSGSN